MGFYNFDKSEKPAVITYEKVYSYEQLNNDIDNVCVNLVAKNKKLVLILCENNYSDIVIYLATLRSNHVAMLLSADIDELLLNQIILVYKPEWIYGKQTIRGYISISNGLNKCVSATDMKIHPDLSIMLSTSGTTGSKKFVRLSNKNIQANAESIVDYLQLDRSERGMINLPISYSYGLSIVNSHLEAGATILLTNESVVSKKFWSFMSNQQGTSFSGVPFTYQVLNRIGFLEMELPHLRYFTQAGGRLSNELIEKFANYAKMKEKKFYIMYGQTEASPRISYIPPHMILDKIGSIGIPIPNGKLELDSVTNELIYYGPNVMMGYATSLSDLEKADELSGVLRTGDIACIDNDGYYTIIGRAKRFIKLFGLRINLDEVEKVIEQQLNIVVACTGSDDKMILLVESKGATQLIKEVLNDRFKLHHTSYRVIEVNKIPRFTNGKINYGEIKEGL